MSHPNPGHDYTERSNNESRKEYANRKGAALGKREHFPKEYVDAKRGMRRVLKKVRASSAKVKALDTLKNKENK